MAFAGKVEVAHRGLKESVAHVLLDVADIDARFEQVSGVAVAQRIIILLTNSLPRRSIIDIIPFMEQKSKSCAPCAAWTRKVL